LLLDFLALSDKSVECCVSVRLRTTNDRFLLGDGICALAIVGAPGAGSRAS